MSEFEFVFPLFALLVGLSVTEMLAGLAHALKSKRDIHVGWLTPLLGTLILINLAMFWQGSWEMRDSMTASSSSFLLVLAVGGTYFLAASLTFPSWEQTSATSTSISWTIGNWRCWRSRPAMSSISSA